MDRRGFLKSCCATAFALAAGRTAKGMGVAFSMPRLDPDLTLFLSDIHINGHLDKYMQHERPSLMKIVAEIAKLDPLPKCAICFGDLAYLWGHKEDYALARELLKPITDLGIELTIAMGNHDRRSAFLEVYPEYAKSTKIPGRIVSVVDADAVDFVLLDGLMGTDDRRPDDCGPGGCSLDAAQSEWFVDALSKFAKPVFVCSHWGVGGIQVCGKKLSKMLIDNPMVAGYIHGHDHYWRKGIVGESWTSPRILKTLCLPSTGHWGDIGYALMRVDGGVATVSLRQNDFWFPEPTPEKPGANRELWRRNTEENQGLTCAFTLPKV